MKFVKINNQIDEAIYKDTMLLPGAYSYFVTDNAMFENMRRFMEARHQVYLNRVGGMQPPYTNDEILQQYKFTNCMRILDRVTQYMVREIIEKDRRAEVPTHKTMMRVYLYKLFNKAETWPLIDEDWRDDPVRYVEDIMYWADNTPGIYGNAHLRAAPDGVENFTWSQVYMRTMQRMSLEGFFKISWGYIGDIYEQLVQYNGFGPFMAYQYALDFSYVLGLPVVRFVVPGVGCQRGMKRVFGDIKPYQMVLILRTLEHFSRDVLPHNLIGGVPFLISDWQNCFCEFDKYSRVAYPETGKPKKIKNTYTPGRELEPLHLPAPWLLANSVGNVEREEAMERGRYE